MTRLSRRRLLQSAVIASAAAAIPGMALANNVNSRLRVASIGTGGKGRDDLQQVAASDRVEVVAICNIDQSKDHFGWAAEAYPKSKHYQDWRRLLDDASSFDAVIVSTPDHMHAPIALPAMQLGKHVYCQKPLTHTVHEARQLRMAAQKYNLVTQMGNQIQSHPFYRTAVQIVHDGVIGKVTEVRSWQSGKMGWMLVGDRPAGSDPIPPHVKWNEWLGVAPERPFKESIYHPFNWRAWQDFSSGQLGDFGCHILDPVFNALKLTAPTSVRADAPELNREVWSLWSAVEWQFPATEFTNGPVKVTWHDGDGRKPSLDGLGLATGYELPASGSVLVGDKGSLVIPHVGEPQLFENAQAKPYEGPVQEELNHYTGWAHACLGDGTTGSNFDYAGPLTETVLLGVIAIRLKGQTLNWDAEKMEVTNHATATQLLTKPYRRGWEPKWL
ncbi:MAG: Gfo/Idh/MocA family oxidoreductase [Planctomyces sp.]|nr:Gfo/Idh/MocA family oxidoreductase [Planctomyces sp.]